MRVVEKAAELGRSLGKRGVVMTMGALHEGHLRLVRAARDMCDEVVVTIFVNPLQFNDPSDLARYPRTLAADLEALEPLGVDLVFAPSLEEMYPAGPPVVRVSAGRVGEIFEGAARPGHFDGMLTVVLKLLNLTAPDVAYFGAKDAQQVIAVRRMVADFNLPVKIETVPTVRDPDGLAKSSRNVFLSPEERQLALAIPRALAEAAGALEGGLSLPDALVAGRSQLTGLDVDYFAALNPASAESVPNDYRGEVLLAVAAKVGQTRLIDNRPAMVR